VYLQAKHGSATMWVMIGSCGGGVRGALDWFGRRDPGKTRHRTSICAAS
jgi:hypothetical protein